MRMRYVCEYVHRWSVGRVRGYMQESAVSFHHVDSREGTQVSGWSTDAFVPTEPSCRLPRSFLRSYVFFSCMCCMFHMNRYMCAHAHGGLTLMSCLPLLLSILFF